MRKAETVTNFDPFKDAAPVTADEASAWQAENNQWPEENKSEETTTVQNNTPEVQTVQENSGEISVTLKGGTGYDAPWVVVRDSDPEKVLETMKDSAMGEVIEWAAKIGAHFGNKVVEYKPAAKSSPQPQQQAPQSAAQPATQSSGDGRQCAHGAMIYRDGVSKAGNAYKGYFCPAQDRSEQCKPQFLPNK